MWIKLAVPASGRGLTLRSPAVRAPTADDLEVMLRETRCGSRRSNLPIPAAVYRMRHGRDDDLEFESA